MGRASVIFGLDFELPPTKAQIIHVREEDGVVEGYFYVVSLDSRLRFPLPDFMVQVLTNYGIASS